MPNSFRGRQDRRCFPRCPLTLRANLLRRGMRWRCRVVDLSFHGGLVEMSSPSSLRRDEPIELELLLAEGPPLLLKGQVSHREGQMIGITCRAIDIDDQHRLRTLLDDF